MRPRRTRSRRRCSSPSSAKSRGYNILEVDVTHKERDTGEVTLRRFRLLKFCARGLGQMLGLIRRVR